MTRTKSPDRLAGRTKLITAASIGAVGLAGLFAIGANLGILSRTDAGAIGTVDATGDLVPAETRVVDVYLDEQGDPPASTTRPASGSQRFAVDVAGTVDVSASAGRVRLDLVTPARGWTSRSVAARGADVAVAFTDGSRSLQFTATVGPDGTVVGDVTESTDTASARPDARHDDEDHDEDHDEDQDEDHSYEGGDSDD